MSTEAKMVDPDEKYTDQEIKKFAISDFNKLIECLDEKLKQNSRDLSVLHRKAKICLVWSQSENCSKESRKTVLLLADSAIVAMSPRDVLDAEGWTLKAKILGELGLHAHQEDCLEIVNSLDLPPTPPLTPPVSILPLPDFTVLTDDDLFKDGEDFEEFDDQVQKGKRQEREEDKNQNTQVWKKKGLKFFEQRNDENVQNACEGLLDIFSQKEFSFGHAVTKGGKK